MANALTRYKICALLPDSGRTFRGEGAKCAKDFRLGDKTCYNAIAMTNSIGKNDKNAAPIVAIDGTAIKGIREAKKLTQLYVANVVGVTTDTISRWENNRYPTVKRDNAEKLAMALEVELPEILRREPVPEEASLATPEKRDWRLVASLAVIVVVVLVVGIFIYQRSITRLVAVRWLPHYGAPGQIVPVQIKVLRPNSDSGGFIVKERLPAGGRFVRSNPPAAGDVGGGAVKWLIAGGSGPVTISYTMTLPQGLQADTLARFNGELVRREGPGTSKDDIGGDDTITVGGYHWADSNGDHRIDDNEIMPAYYLTEEMKGLGLDWRTIENIWSGRGYRWNERKKGYEVVK